MKQIRFIIISLCILTLYTSSRAENYPTGAANIGMGGTSIGFSNLWSVNQNQGALGFLDGMYAGLYYQNSFMVQEMSIKSFAFAMNLKPGTLGLNVSNYGFKLFSDNKIGLAYGLKLSPTISMGIQLDYFYLKQQNYYGSYSIISGEIGLLAKPTDKLSVGAHIFNPWRSKLSKNTIERLPTILKLGFIYQFSSKVFYGLEFEKDLDLPFVFKTGVQYEPIKNLILRTGFSVSDKMFFPSFGIGYTFKDITLDIGFQSQPVTGIKSGISIVYKFK